MTKQKQTLCNWCDSTATYKVNGEYTCNYHLHVWFSDQEIQEAKTL